MTGILLWTDLNFRRDRQGRRGGGMALHVRGCSDVVEIRASNVKVRLRGKDNRTDILFGVC